MNKIASWFRNLIADTTPIKTEYMVVDPSAPNDEIRPITLALTPGDEASQEIIISAYWDQNQNKVFEKKITDMEEAKHLFSVIASDFQKASELAKEGKKDESKNLIESLVAKYAASTDSLTQPYNPPLTETNASKKVLTLSKVALKLWQSSSNYMGDDFSDYYVGPSVNYERDPLQVSNYEVALEMLGGEGNGVLAAHFSSWAGAFDIILVHKDSADKVAILQDIESKLAAYPVLDEEDYSEREFKERGESYESWAKADALKILDQELHRQNPDLQGSVSDLDLSDVEERLARIVFEDLSYGDGTALHPEHLIEEAEEEGLLKSLRDKLEGKEVIPEAPRQQKLFESELKKSFIKRAIQRQAHKKLKAPVFEAKSQNPLIRKQAKITFQNIFFDTPEEVMEYQEKMKALQPDQGTGVPLWDEVNEQVKQPEAEESEDLELAPPSVSYDQMEKDKAKETKNLDKRIEKEVKEQIQSTLDVKRATLFSEKDDALVEAMRGVGRTWEEVREYIIKELKYDKDSVVIYLDEKRAKEEGIHEEPKPLTPPKPPEELVSPETHDKLVEEVKEKSEPKDELKLEPVEEIARADNGEIKKVALNPLQEPPAAVSTPPAPPEGAPPIPQEMAPAIESTEPAQGDRVYVEGDVESKEEGFEGTFVSSFDQKGDNMAVIALDNGQNKEVPMHRVVKASKKAASWNTYECKSCGTKLRGPAWKACPVCRAPSSDVVDTGKEWVDKEAAGEKCPTCGGLLDDWADTHPQEKCPHTKKEAHCGHCEKKADYEGWANFDTWGLALYLDNDQALYNESRALAKDVYENVHGDPIGELANALQINYRNVFLQQGDTGKNINEVNWKDIAQELLRETKETKEDEQSVSPETIINKLPVMDIEKSKDELLNQLAKETDPEKKKSLERRYKHLTMASLHKQAFINTPEQEVQELISYAENERDLYNQFTSIIDNLKRKIKRGVYDPVLAPKLWSYWYDEAARKYFAEFGHKFSTAIRQQAANITAKDEYAKIMAGEYNSPVEQPKETPEGLSASQVLAQIKKEAEALVKEAEERVCKECGGPLGNVGLYRNVLGPICDKCVKEKSKKDAATHTKCVRCDKELPVSEMVENVHGAGYLCKDHAEEWNKDSSLKVKADPEVVPEAPKPEPVDFKQQKIAPPHTEKEKAIPATPEIAKTITEIQRTQDNIDQIKRLLAEAESKLKKEKIEIEKQMDRPGLEAKLKQEIEKLYIMVDATESKLVEMGEVMVRLVSGEKTIEYKFSDKELLERAMKEFPKVVKFIENVKNGAQSLAKTESFRELRMFPKRMSKLHTSAGIMDTLSKMYEDAMNALRGLSEILSVEKEVAPTIVDKK